MQHTNFRLRPDYENFYTVSDEVGITSETRMSSVADYDVFLLELVVVRFGE